MNRSKIKKRQQYNIFNRIFLISIQFSIKLINRSNLNVYSIEKKNLRLHFNTAIHNELKYENYSNLGKLLQPENPIANNLLHKILGFFSIFSEQSSFWISQNPFSKFPIQQASARTLDLPEHSQTSPKIQSSVISHNFFLHNIPPKS